MTLTDISERKQLENDRAYLYEEMKRALRVREELLGFASHDLRNPLQIILLSLQLQSFVHDVLESFLPIAQEKSIELLTENVENSCVVFCDPDRLLQVFTNLLGNAIKFSNSNSTIRIRLEECGVDKAVLSIADSGPGISLEVQAHLFERFWQGRESRTHGGAGLGRSIAKGIIEAHWGEIEVESELGHGSVFKFSIPKRSMKIIDRAKS
ncbi:MAG: HAMP domain-containing sensor histidine kinase [Bdellovibrionia bacterium]